MRRHADAGKEECIDRAVFECRRLNNRGLVMTLTFGDRRSSVARRLKHDDLDAIDETWKDEEPYQDTRFVCELSTFAECEMRQRGTKKNDYVENRLTKIYIQAIKN